MKQFLLFVAAALLFRISAFAQAPNFVYSPAINNLTVGAPFTITPTNNGGGLVPATIYGKVTTLAGSGTQGYNDAMGTSAQFNTPYTMVGDGAGNLYVADAGNNAIRMITPGGVVSTFAGNPTVPAGLNNGPIATALFNNPQGIAIDASGNLFVSDYGNHVIREITTAGIVSTFYQYDPTFGPAGLCFDSSGNLIVADEDESLIIKITPAGVGTVIAGTTYGYADGAGTTIAQFAFPEDVQLDAAGNIVVADYLNNVIRKIDPSGVVTTFAGNQQANPPGFADGTGAAALFYNPTGLALGSGNIIYVADLYNNAIRRILPDGTVSLVAGDASQAPGAADGTGTGASFNQPVDLYIDGTGTGYVADAQNGDIRKIILTGYTIDKPLPAGLSFDQTTGTISGTPTSSFGPTTYIITAYNASGYAITDVTLSTVPAGQAPIFAYSPATNSLTIGSPFTITPTNSGGAVPATIYGQVTTLAGAGSAGYTNAVGTAAFFNTPEAITGDAAGNIYVADDHNNAIRKIAPDGTVTTVAGSLSGAQGDLNGTGTAALFYHPDGIAIDGSGNLFISDGKNNKIKKITLPAGVVSTFAAVNSPAGLRFDGSGNLIVAAQGSDQIIQISPAGTITSIAGGSGGSADGTGAAAQFNFPSDLALNGSGNIFVADYLNNEIRKIAPVGVTTTFAGSTVAGYANGVGTAALFNNPTGVAFGSGSIIYVADFANNNIRQIMPDGTVSLVAGSPTQAGGATNGTGKAALFNQPDALYIDGSGTGYVTEYQNSTVRKIILTGYTIDKTLPAGLSFDQTTGTISGTPTVPVIGTTYKVTAYNAYGYATTVITLSSYNNWTGGTSDWSTASNWSQNLVPVVGSVAQIGIVPYTAGTAQPILASSSTIGSVRFGSNNIPALTINSGQTLTVTDSLRVDSLSTATINGPGSITLGGTSIINPTASLIASLNAVIALAPAATLTNNGTFTLASDVNGSASIAAIPAGASITGTVNVQRFIRGHSDINERGYRLLTSSVYTGTVGGVNVYDLQYLLNSVYVSGAGAAANGFNVSTTQNPSVYLFREDVPPPPTGTTSFTTGYNWKGVAQIGINPPFTGTQNKNDQANLMDTLTTIPAGNAVLFFFRGDKTVNLTAPFTPPNDVTLTETGTLNTGNITVTPWFANAGNGLGATLSWTDPGASPNYTSSSSILTNGYALVGNPYPCTINWEKFNNSYAPGALGGTLSNNTIWVFNAVNKHYEPYMPKADDQDVTSEFTMENGNTNGGIPNGAASNFIASGQGFFVRAMAKGQTLTFTENAKINTQPTAANVNALMGTPVQTAAAPHPIIRLRMVMDTINTANIVIRLDNKASTKFAINEDAEDIGGNGQLLGFSSFSSDSIRLSINSSPYPGVKPEVIRLQSNSSSTGTYSITVPMVKNLPALYQAWLKDTFTGDSLQLKTNASYQFTIDKSNAATFGGNRFTLIIRQDPAMAYQLLSFTGSKLPTAPEVQLVWKTANEQNYTNFTVERSTNDGKTFDVLGGLQGTGVGTYSLLDKDPVTGQNLYRLKQEDINNAITYSNVVTIQYSDLSNNNLDNLNLFPNPANSSINLAIVATPDGTATYNIKFVNSSGLVVKEVNSSQPSWQGNISSLKPGTYFVRVFSNKDQSLVGRTKFVKL